MEPIDYVNVPNAPSSDKQLILAYGALRTDVKAPKEFLTAAHAWKKIPTTSDEPPYGVIGMGRSKYPYEMYFNGCAVIPVESFNSGTHIKGQIFVTPFSSLKYLDKEMSKLGLERILTKIDFLKITASNDVLPEVKVGWLYVSKLSSIHYNKSVIRLEDDYKESIKALCRVKSN